MPIHLWHSTWPEFAELILANGFRDGENGFVFFGLPRDTTWILSGKVLLEVSLDISADMIDGYKSESVDTDGGNYCQILFKIPATVVKDHQTAIRTVPVAEYCQIADDEQ
jgi:hypothetical protein